VTICSNISNVTDWADLGNFLEETIGKLMGERKTEEPQVHIKQARVGADVRHEEAILVECAHPNVIACYGASEDSTELRIEKGEHDLYSHIADTENCQLKPEEVLEIANGLASGLAVVHDQGYAHNDLKMENVVMCKASDGKLVPKLIDFEFAHHVDHPPPEGEDKVAGTRAYFSPEKWLHVPDYNRQADDMWALGVTMHLAAFGCYPNGTIEALPTLLKDYEAPSYTNEKLAALLEGLMKVCPTERWTAVDVKKHLDGGFVFQPQFQSMLGAVTEGTTDFSISIIPEHATLSLA